MAAVFFWINAKTGSYLQMALPLKRQCRQEGGGVFFRAIQACCGSGMTRVTKVG
jgi:hypothetical protein